MNTFQITLAVVFGVVGYLQATRIQKKYGRPAWGMPAWVWALIWFVSLLIGAILMLIAERSLKKEAETQGYPPPPPA